MVGIWRILLNTRNLLMEEIAISKFKATCLAVLERVRKTGQPIRVTRFGHPVAEITPPSSERRVPRLGTGAGTMVILGDIVGPISDESEWEAAQDGEATTGEPSK
jgi:prevent-host-death family protein